MGAILRYPVYFLELFTTAKSFKNNPIIGSSVLNRLGLHVFRVVLAYAIMRFRMGLLSFGVPKQYRDDYLKRGYILIPNLLSDEDFAKLYDEVRALRGEVRECVQGDTLTQRIHLDGETLETMPETRRFLARPDLSKLWRFAAGFNLVPISHVQVIKSHYVEGGEDPQKNLHSDTFHPSMKYWFFLEDVTPDEGPFTYVEGSQRLTWKRLAWEYRKSIAMDEEKDAYVRSGSFRVEASELEGLGFGEPKAVCVPRNTLAIVNTFGFHRRGDADGRRMRSEIWGISRTNPFNPFVGVNAAFFHRLDDRLLQRSRRRQDEAAAKRGVPSSWHVIDSRDLFA